MDNVVRLNRDLLDGDKHIASISTVAKKLTSAVRTLSGPLYGEPTERKAPGGSETEQ
jgi:hypothetical protein